MKCQRDALEYTRVSCVLVSPDTVITELVMDFFSKNEMKIIKVNEYYRYTKGEIRDITYTYSEIILVNKAGRASNENSIDIYKRRSGEGVMVNGYIYGGIKLETNIMSKTGNVYYFEEEGGAFSLLSNNDSKHKEKLEIETAAKHQMEEYKLDQRVGLGEDIMNVMSLEPKKYIHVYDNENMRVVPYLFQEVYFHPKKVTKEKLRDIELKLVNLDVEEKFTIHQFFDGLKKPEVKKEPPKKPLVPNIVIHFMLWITGIFCIILILAVVIYAAKIFYLRYKERERLKKEEELNFVYDLRDF